MGIGIWQIVLILLIVVIIFGAGKLPRVMGDVAKGIKSFKAGMKDEVSDSSAPPAPPPAEPATQAREKAEETEDTAKS